MAKLRSRSRVRKSDQGFRRATVVLAALIVLFLAISAMSRIASPTLSPTCPSFPLALGSQFIWGALGLGVLVLLVVAAAMWAGRHNGVSYIVESAWGDWDAGHAQAAIKRLAELVPRLVVDREHPEDALAVAALAEMQAYSNHPNEAIALVGRLPLRSTKLTDSELDCLASRALVYARTGMLPKARADRGRLYAHNPGHMRLAEVDDQIAGARSYPKHVDVFTQLSPDDFEDLIGQLFAREGFVVTPTPPSGDGGVDLICQGPFGVEIVQCKRYTGNVGVDPVRSLYGVMAEFNAVHAHIVTSSSFTRGAQEFVAGKPITLVDGDGLALRLGAAGLAR